MCATTAEAGGELRHDRPYPLSCPAVCDGAPPEEPFCRVLISATVLCLAGAVGELGWVARRRCCRHGCIVPSSALRAQ